MKISIAPYNEEWPRQFEQIKGELLHLLKAFEPQIEHFGSTSVPGLAAKPVIDVLVGIQNTDAFEDLTKAVLENGHYLYYQAFNPLAPERRLFVRLKDAINPTTFQSVYTKLDAIPHDRINQARMAHIHVWKYGSNHWVRHIAFREYLKAHEATKKQYEKLKLQLSNKEWSDGMEYNSGKNAFIKEEERKAILWYQNRKEEERK